ncbi:MAG: peptidase S9, partial [Bacteroidia bacterium]|nr:peptidase S9 [Bacteroidia bacterium]
MKSKLLIMLISSAVLTSACSSGGGNKEEGTPISRSTITVKDGIMTPEVMHNMGKVSDPQLSPDGKEILFGVSFTDIAQNKNNRELFVMNLDGSGKRQITSTVKSENNARWTKDGNQILFLQGGELLK